MTIRQEPTLWCDGIDDDDAPTGVRHAEATQTPGPRGAVYYGDDGCPYWIDEGGDAKAIRAVARRRGWRRIGGRDYSPQCYRLLTQEQQ